MLDRGEGSGVRETKIRETYGRLDFSAELVLLHDKPPVARGHQPLAAGRQTEF
jgi:hypothetical protein